MAIASSPRWDTNSFTGGIFRKFCAVDYFCFQINLKFKCANNDIFLLGKIISFLIMLLHISNFINRKSNWKYIELSFYQWKILYWTKFKMNNQKWKIVYQKEKVASLFLIFKNAVNFTQTHTAKMRGIPIILLQFKILE